MSERHRIRSFTISSKMVVPNANSNLKFDFGKIAFSLIPFTPESQGRRKTILNEIVKNKIWTLDQLQGIINVNGKLISI